MILVQFPFYGAFFSIKIIIVILLAILIRRLILTKIYNIKNWEKMCLTIYKNIIIGEHGVKRQNDFVIPLLDEINFSDFVRWNIT